MSNWPSREIDLNCKVNLNNTRNQQIRASAEPQKSPKVFFIKFPWRIFSGALPAWMSPLKESLIFLLLSLGWGGRSLYILVSSPELRWICVCVISLQQSMTSFGFCTSSLWDISSEISGRVAAVTLFRHSYLSSTSRRSSSSAELKSSNACLRTSCSCELTN